MKPFATSRFLAAIVLATFGLCSRTALAQEALETDWVSAQADKARARLSAGTQGGQDFALIEIELAPGWKTYWRNPGEAGLPPELNWDGSVNITQAELLYPAPHRFVDKAGETLGYKDRVMFPVKFTRANSNAAAMLVANLQYGVCKEVCIPAEARFTLTLPEGKLPEIRGDILVSVPRAQASLLSGDPAIVRAEAVFDDGDPRIEIEVQAPANGADPHAAFLDASGGVYVPSPEFAKDVGPGRKLFVAKLGGVDVAALKDRNITATVTSETGASTKDVNKSP